jgi:hypothetical protein
MSTSLGWGPSGSVNADIPYSPFSKQDPLGKPADWFQHQQSSGEHRHHRVQEVDEAVFSLVDSKTKSKGKVATASAKPMSSMRGAPWRKNALMAARWGQQQPAKKK